MSPRSVLLAALIALAIVVPAALADTTLRHRVAPAAGTGYRALQQIMDNHDGTLSLFGTILDSAAPAAAPPSGNAGAFTTAQLASVARTLAFNDPQREGSEGTAGDAEKSGRRRDRNVELLVRDPRWYARPKFRRIPAGPARRTSGHVY